MVRNLVLCCDGTSNTFGKVNTNVVRIVQILKHDDPNQLVYYDPGVGTLPEPGRITRIGKTVSEWIDLAFATSLARNVQEAYTYLMNTWQPEDRVFIFGFSRGAYTARVIAAMLHHIGLLPAGMDNLVPYAIRLLRAARKDDRKIGDEFRRTFARQTNGNERHFPIHFVGVWDSVSSVGWVWDPVKYQHTAFNPSIATVRHAISIDERRAFYRQNRMKPAPGQNFEQVWFPGVHSDIGGGYSDSNLWRCAFDWMIDAARHADLMIDEERLREIAPPIARVWTEKQHDELRAKKKWWIAEFFPKLHWNSAKKRNTYHINRGQCRGILDGELLHETTLRRIQDVPEYTPKNISEAFIEYVRKLGAIPPTMTYEDAPVATAVVNPAHRAA